MNLDLPALLMNPGHLVLNVCVHGGSAHTSLVASKLRRPFVSKHPDLVGKPPQFRKDKEAGAKRRRIDTETPGFSSMRSATEASFRVAYLVAV